VPGKEEGTYSRKARSPIEVIGRYRRGSDLLKLAGGEVPELQKKTCLKKKEKAEASGGPWEKGIINPRLNWENKGLCQWGYMGCRNSNCSEIDHGGTLNYFLRYRLLGGRGLC